MIIFILLLSFIVRLININQSLWLDEAAQVIESARPLSQQLKIEGDFQPPLFHIILHFWMKFGTSEIWMRLLTIIISVLSIYIFYKIGEKIVNKKFAVLSSFLLAINSFAIYYSQELRPYPLTVLVSLLATWGYVTSSSLFLIIGLSLFLYTTYFAPFFIIALFLYVVIKDRKKLKWFLTNTIISFLIFVPWIPSFLEQLKIGTSLTTTLPGWGEAVSTPPIKAIPLIFAKFFLGRITIDNKIIYGSIVMALIGVFFYFVYISRKNRNHSFFSILFFVPLILAFLPSLVIPIIEAKRLLFILPFFLGIIALGNIEVKQQLKRIFLSLIIISSIYGLFQYFTNPRFQREQWRQAVAFVEQNGDGTQIALFAFPQPFAPYQWYSQNRIYSYGVAKNFVVSDIDIVKVRKLVEQRNHIYLFQYLSELTDPRNKLPKILEEEGFVLTNTYDFPGVGFIYEYYKKSLALAP